MAGPFHQGRPLEGVLVVVLVAIAAEQRLAAPCRSAWVRLVERCGGGTVSPG